MRKLLLIATLFVLTAHAAEKPLYRFVDERGVTHYTDKAPNKHAKPLALGKFSGQHSAPAPRSNFAVLPNTPRFAVHFDTPTPEQIYYDETRPVTVALSVMPGLISGFGLMLKVNGENVSKTPLREINATLPDLGAGTHTVVAVLVNARGQELARSSPLKIHVRPRLAKN